MRSAKNLFQRISRPPGVRQTPELEPTGRNNLESTGDFKEGLPGKAIVWSDEGFGPTESRLQQTICPVRKTPRKFHLRAAAEFKAVVMESVLKNMEFRVFAQVVDQFRIAADGGGRAQGRVRLQKALWPSGRGSGGCGYIRDDSQVHWQAALEEGSVQTIETGCRRKGIGIVVTNDYVTHGLSFPGLGLRTISSSGRRPRRGYSLG